MLSTVSHFLMFEPGSGRRGALQIQTKEPIKMIRVAPNFTNQHGLELAKPTK